MVVQLHAGSGTVQCYTQVEDGFGTTQCGTELDMVDIFGTIEFGAVGV